MFEQTMCIYIYMSFWHLGKLLASGGLSDEMISKKAKRAGNAAVQKVFGAG